MSARKQIGSDDVVDMELHCVACGTSFDKSATRGTTERQ